jgi:hypothetical protein
MILWCNITLKQIEQTILNENNRHFMILFVTLKETYTFFLRR